MNSSWREAEKLFQFGQKKEKKKPRIVIPYIQLSEFCIPSAAILANPFD